MFPTLDELVKIQSQISPKVVNLSPRTGAQKTVFLTSFPCDSSDQRDIRTTSLFQSYHFSKEEIEAQRGK